MGVLTHPSLPNYKASEQSADKQLQTNAMRLKRGPTGWHSWRRLQIPSPSEDGACQTGIMQSLQPHKGNHIEVWQRSVIWGVSRAGSISLVFLSKSCLAIHLVVALLARTACEKAVIRKHIGHGKSTEQLHLDILT
jgi:hypothetical protein